MMALRKTAAERLTAAYAAQRQAIAAGNAAAADKANTTIQQIRGTLRDKMQAAAQAGDTELAAKLGAQFEAESQRYVAEREAAIAERGAPQYVSTVREKLMAWGLTGAQADKFAQFATLVRGGTQEAVAAAQAGISTAQIADWRQVAAMELPELVAGINKRIAAGETINWEEGFNVRTVGPYAGSIAGASDVLPNRGPGGGQVEIDPATGATRDQSGYVTAGVGGALPAGWKAGASGTGGTTGTGTGAGIQSRSAADETAVAPTTTTNPLTVAGVTIPGLTTTGVAALPSYAGVQQFATGFHIPEGGRVIRVARPVGSDSPYLYHILYTVYGVDMTFEVGDQTRFQELFGRGGMNAFDQHETLSQGRFDALGALEMGFIDEQLTTTESIQSQIERGVRELGFEDIPEWMRQPEAATVLFQGMSEGWSPGRVLQALSATQPFRGRFNGIEGLQSVMGTTTLTEVVDEYLARETKLEELLVTYRGAGTNLDRRYLGNLIGMGWAPAEVEEILKGEQLIRSQPGAMIEMNGILTASGLEPVTGATFLQIMRGNAAPQVYEAINDTLRARALREQGLVIDSALAAELGEGVAFSVASASERGQFTTAAQQAAYAIISNRLELEANKFGIKRDDIVKAAFGEGYSQEVEVKLQKFARERQTAAEGYGGTSGYQSSQGRLVIPGLQGL